MMATGETFQERSKGRDVRTSNIVAAKVKYEYYVPMREKNGAPCGSAVRENPSFTTSIVCDILSHVVVVVSHYICFISCVIMLF
jgi:hypothetical protein